MKFKFKIETHAPVGHVSTHYRTVVANELGEAFRAVAGEAYPFGWKEIAVYASDVENSIKAEAGIRETECAGCSEIFYESEVQSGLCVGCWNRSTE